MTEQETAVFDALTAFGKARVIDIASATAINKGNVYRILSTLWTNRRVHKEEIGRDVFYEVLQP